MPQKVSLAALGSLLCAAICWGFAPVATRYTLGTLAPLQVLLLRFGLSSLLFLPLLFAIRKHGWSPQDNWRIIACSFCNVIGYNTATTFGLRWLPASTASLLIATSPIWIALFSVLLNKERIRGLLVAGLLLSLSGSLLLTGGNALSGTQWQASALFGALLVLLGAMMWGLYTVLARPLSLKYGATFSTGISIVFGTLPLFLFWNPHLLPQLQRLSPLVWFAILFLVLGSTMLGMLLWNYGVARIASAQAGLFLYIVPVVSVSGGALFLHERIGTTIWLSGLLIIAGVVLAQIRPGKRA
jgi:drug/metabolite transporter (DMT)-like permease